MSRITGVLNDCYTRDADSRPVSRRQSSCSMYFSGTHKDIIYTAKLFDSQGSTEMIETLQLFPNDESKEKGSIYSLDMAHQVDLLAAGSTDAVVRIFDLRQGRKIMKLKVTQIEIPCFHFTTMILLQTSTSNRLIPWILCSIPDS